MGFRGYVARSTSRLLQESQGTISQEGNKRPGRDSWKELPPPGLPRLPANHKTPTQAWWVCQPWYDAEAYDRWGVLVVTLVPLSRLQGTFSRNSCGPEITGIATTRPSKESLSDDGDDEDEDDDDSFKSHTWNMPQR